MTWKNTP